MPTRFNTRSVRRREGKERRRPLCRKSIGAPGDNVESCSIPTVP